MIITGLLAGVYDSFTAKEGLCVAIDSTDTVRLVNPPMIARTVTGKNPSGCGYCDGIDTVWGLHPGQTDTITYSYTAFGGLPGSTTTSSVQRFISADSSVIITGLCGGHYTNVIINTAGVCDVTLPGPYTLDTMMLYAKFVDTVHYGCNGDTIVFTDSSGPASTLTYEWFFGDGSSGTDVSPYHIYPNTNDNTVTIKLYISNTKCVDSFIKTETLNNYIKGGFTFTPDPFVCQDSAVTFTNTSTGTNPTYTWIFGDGITSNAVNPVHFYTYTGKYKVTLVANENILPVPNYYTQCADTIVQTIDVDSISAVSILATDSVLCQGEGITFKGIYSTLGDTLEAWSFGDGGSIYNVNPVLHAYDGSGQFTVNLAVKYRACPDGNATRNIVVFGYPSIYMGPDLSICPGGNPITLIDDRNESNPKAKWLWNTGDTTAGITIAQPGTYSNVVTIDGCSASDTVVVLKDCYMDIPNVFTPNGDGTNDYFYPRQLLTRGLTTFKMDIYNRWGQMVYETTNTDGRGWDGEFNNKPQPEGVYVYVIDATFKDGQIEHHQGNITLLR